MHVYSKTAIEHILHTCSTEHNPMQTINEKDIWFVHAYTISPSTENATRNIQTIWMQTDW